jgi:enoyl-CoA hydratase/carnithine racemase
VADSGTRGPSGPARSAESGTDGVLVERDGDVVTIWMNRPERRNALSLDQMVALRDAFAAVGEGDARGVVLGGKGPVFSAGHDFADLAGADLAAVRRLLNECTELMDTIQAIPQIVIARVHGLATAAGCQLVATCDLAVAVDTAGFAAPGGKGGWFCTTPMVAIGRNLARKHALELALTGDPIDAVTAMQWGLVNRVVPEAELDDATLGLLDRATRGSANSKGLGKQAFYRQIGLDQPQAYSYAMEVMAAASQTADAQEGVAAFLEKRPPKFGAG